MVNREDFQKAIELIEHSNSVLLTTHTRPDGDACACVAALWEVLSRTGRKVDTLFLSPIPQWYEFLFDSPPAVLGKDLAADHLRQHLSRPDLIIIIDTNSYSQLPGFDQCLRASPAAVLVIDHHITSDNLGSVQLIDTAAAAAGLVVYDFFKFAGWQVTQRIAEALFVAIASDTGWFRFTNTDSRVLSTCAELADAGADIAAVHRRLYQSFSVQRFRLMVAVLNSLELHFDGRYAAQHIRLDDFSRTGASPRDTENLVDECRRIAGVEVAALFVEQQDGRIRCSLRSNGRVDVRRIAERFGGGGHKAAAGLYLPGPLEKAKALIRQQIGQELQNA